MFGIRRICVQSFVIAAVVVSSTAYAEQTTSEYAEFVGQWKIQINAGGEIYKGKFQIMERDGKLTGIYESDEGRRTRINAIKIKGKTIRLEARTQRFSVPVSAVFIADVEDGKMQGEADFSTGTMSRSNGFSAVKVTGGVAKPAMTREVMSERTQDKKQIPSQPPTGKLSFQHGVNGYKGTVDVEVWSIAPGKALEKQGTLTSDGNNGGGESQVLMRFDGIFGKSGEQIPRNARIKSATLRVVAFDPGTTVYVHRVFVPWTAAATWNGLANGLTIDNIEASTVRDGFTFGQINMDRQSVEFDVTQTVQHWSDGEQNYGWVFVNTGSNGWDFYSADWHEIELRPTLFVEYEVRTPKKIEAVPVTDAGSVDQVAAE